MMRLFAFLMLAAALSSAACGKNDTATTPTTTTPATTAEVWAGTLSARGSGFFSFAVLNAGTASITFGSLVDASSGRPIETSVALGLGRPRREECELSTTVTASPGLVAQLSSAVTPGIYCAQLSDIGNVRAAAAFGVRIVHP